MQGHDDQLPGRPRLLNQLRLWRPGPDIQCHVCMRWHDNQYADLPQRYVLRPLRLFVCIVGMFATFLCVCSPFLTSFFSPLPAGKASCLPPGVTYCGNSGPFIGAPYAAQGMTINNCNQGACRIRACNSWSPVVSQCAEISGLKCAGNACPAQ